MSNHGDDPESIRKTLEAFQKQFGEPLGATGRFPMGKLNDNDEGEIRMGVFAKSGQVIINFGKPVAWIGLPPDQAMVLGKTLIEKANQLWPISGSSAKEDKK